MPDLAYRSSSLQALGARVLPPLLGALTRAQRPVIAGKVMRTMLEPIRPARTQNAIRVVILPKSGFTEDALSAIGSDPSFALYGLSRAYLKSAFASFLPKWVDDNNYRSAPAELEVDKARLREHWRLAWPQIQATARANAVMTGNFGYFAEQEFAAAVQASGVPVIAMHKEAMKTEGRREHFEKLYGERRQPFAGARILVYNEFERGIQVRAGTVGEDRVTVVGMPRLDMLHAWRKSAARGEAGPLGDRPRVLMFSFHFKTGLPYIPRKSAGNGAWIESTNTGMVDFTWAKLHAGFHRVAVRIARECPDIEVVVKGKTNLPKWMQITARKPLSLERLPNLRVVMGGDPGDLISGSSVVSGMNSTALLEGLAAGRRTVVPRFEEALDPRADPFFLDLGDAVETADSEEDLFVRLRDAARNPLPLTETLGAGSARELETWAGNADGAAGARVARAIAAEVASAGASGQM